MNKGPGGALTAEQTPSSATKASRPRPARPTRKPARPLRPPEPSPEFTASSSTMFRVDLDLFRGPLDLLLYLVRKHELQATDLPLASITEQYLDHLAVLEVLDINAVGDFLEVASWLIEIKSRMLLPDNEAVEDTSEPLEEPGQHLVEQLLQYKQYRDAASILEERGRSWSQCFTRLANDLPSREIDPASQPIHELELWDLVSAMGRVLRANERVQPANIVYDDTPIHIHMQNIHRRLCDDGQVAFTDMFRPNMNKATLIGIFLAVLELVRHHCVWVEQEEVGSEIYLKPGAEFRDELTVTEVDEYESTVKPR